MGTATIIIANAAAREMAVRWLGKAPWNTRVTFKASKRTVPQNDRMWAMLTDVAAQVEWYGQYFSPDDWKHIFTASLRQSRVVPGIDKGTFVILGTSTSKMEVEEMSDLIEIIHAFGAERGVIFHDGEITA